MKRWHLTLGLAIAAAIALAVAPRLSSGPGPTPAARATTTPDTSSGSSPQDSATSPLRLAAGFERSSVLTGAGPQVRYLTVEVSAPARVTARAPLDLVVVLDTSASMGATGKLDAARRAATVLAERLRPDDTLSVVGFADDATVLIPRGPVDHPGRLGLVLSTLYAGGGSNVYAGLQVAGHTLPKLSSGGRDRRLLLLSDGAPNVGVLDPRALVQLATDLQQDGVTVSAFGLGLDHDDDLLASLAAAGGGAYTFVDDAAHLADLLLGEVDRQVALRGAEIEVLVPETVRLVDALGWGEDRHDADKWSVLVGDVAPGERRRVVFAVEVDGTRPGAPVLVRAAYEDPTQPGERRMAVGRAPLTFTTDPARVDESADVARIVLALRAQSAVALEAAADALTRGERARAAQRIIGAADALRDGAARWPNAELQRLTETLDELGAACATATDLGATTRIVKEIQELARALAR